MQNIKKLYTIVPREKDAAKYKTLDDISKFRRRKAGLDEDRRFEYIEKEKLAAYRQAIEERYSRDAVAVLRDAAALKCNMKEMAVLMFLLARSVNGECVDEEAFLESYEPVNPIFSADAFDSIADAVESEGEKPIIWRLDILCLR